MNFNFDLNKLAKAERTEAPEKEILEATNFYQSRLSRFGYKIFHDESHRAIARYMALTFFSIDDPRNEYLSSKPEKGLLLYGPVGVGKTMPLKILSGIFKQPFLSAQRLIQEYGVNGESGFWDYADSFTGYDITIDDICAERDLKSYGNATPMIDFFERRENLYRENGILTNYTTNAKGRQDLEERYGERTASRILGMCTAVLVAGEDKRQLKKDGE